MIVKHFQQKQRPYRWDFQWTQQIWLLMHFSESEYPIWYFWQIKRTVTISKVKTCMQHTWIYALLFCAQTKDIFLPFQLPVLGVEYILPFQLAETFVPFAFKHPCAFMVVNAIMEGGDWEANLRCAFITSCVMNDSHVSRDLISPS